MFDDSNIREVQSSKMPWKFCALCMNEFDGAEVVPSLANYANNHPL